MQHTTNYNLNQWEALDKVTRADFNADNAKIDAAIKANADAIANAGGLTTIKTVTITESVSGYVLDVSDIRFAAWKHVYIEMRLFGSGSYYLMLNSTSYQNEKVSAAGSQGKCSRLVLHPLHSATVSAFGELYGGSSASNIGMAEPTFGELTTISLNTVSSGTINAGSTFVILGEK